MGGLESRIGDLEIRMDVLETGMDALKTTVKGLEIRMDGLQTEMEGLKIRIGGLEAEVDELKNRIGCLENKVTKIAVTLEMDISPRLNTIESCYKDTYRRYQVYSDRMEGVFRDVELLKKVVRDHSRKLERYGFAPS